MPRSIVLAISLFAALVATTALDVQAQQPDAAIGACPAQPGVQYAQQGGAWTCQQRQLYYTQDQGSQMIPLAWIKALKHPDGTSFLGDKLARYGYLPDPQATVGLPVGFTLAPSDQGDVVGMTCSACHTRQIVAEGKTIRIDGGPAIVDFQALLQDLDNTVLGVLASDAAFQPFAKAVLGPDYPKQSGILQAEVSVWSIRFHTLMANALPKPGWGPSRLDAVSMIFDRLTGLDLGPPPTYLIPGNIRMADAPVRYPFLWNAPIQDLTQWPGFADNGFDILGLARNLGEVYGVFGTFHPAPQSGWFSYNRNYISNNSANFDGLWALEDSIRTIGPPAWPFGPVDPTKVAQGKDVFNRKINGESCADCHDIHTTLLGLWNTPVDIVGTDTREQGILAHKVDSGSLSGANSPFPTILPTDKAYNILQVSVVNAITQHVTSGSLSATAQAGASLAEAHVVSPMMKSLAPVATTSTGLGTTVIASPDLALLNTAFRPIDSAGAAQRKHASVAGGLVSDTLTSPRRASQVSGGYESRVLKGIWAAAPYLHNGSVPTLAELLKPPAQRVKAFKIGPAYDTTNVGLAVDQTVFDYTLQTTGCDQVDSGNSNCGHTYGTDLSDADKAALIEYLKTF